MEMRALWSSKALIGDPSRQQEGQAHVSAWQCQAAGLGICWQARQNSWELHGCQNHHYHPHSAIHPRPSKQELAGQRVLSSANRGKKHLSALLRATCPGGQHARQEPPLWAQSSALCHTTPHSGGLPSVQKEAFSFLGTGLMAAPKPTP